MSGVMAGVGESYTLPIRLKDRNANGRFCRRGLAFLSRMIASLFLCERERKEVVFWLRPVPPIDPFGPQRPARRRYSDIASIPVRLNSRRFFQARIDNSATVGN